MFSFCEKDAVEVLENLAVLNPQILIEINLQKEFLTVFMVFNQHFGEINLHAKITIKFIMVRQSWCNARKLLLIDSNIVL